MSGAGVSYRCAWCRQVRWSGNPSAAVRDWVCALCILALRDRDPATRDQEVNG